MADKSRYRSALAPITWVAAACLAVWPVSVAQAADDAAAAATAEKGEALSARLCASCHLTGTGGATAVPIGPPTFAGIANKKGQSARDIEYVLINSHPPMPDLHLTKEEIASITLYLETLRTDKSAPPLLKPPGDGKPKYPAPS